MEITSYRVALWTLYDVCGCTCVDEDVSVRLCVCVRVKGVCMGCGVHVYVFVFVSVEGMRGWWVESVYSKETSFFKPFRTFVLY